MKAIILLCCLAGALAFSADDVDYENLVPVFETEEWRAAYPKRAAMLDATKYEKPVYQRGGRIWGDAPNARDALQGEIPYQVGIVVLLSRQAFCGGSLVSANFVLTAADCLPGDPNVIVEVGNTDRNHINEFINGAEKILHPEFNVGENADNDIALIRLVRPVIFSANINIVRLPNRRQQTVSFENQQAAISGWGATESGIIGVDTVRHLRVGFAQVISQAACRIRFPNSSSDHTLCIDGTNVNFCVGDFGGPVTVRDADGITTQIGIASFTQVTGCTRGFPGGMTRISFYLEWINQNSDVIIRDDF